MRMHVDRRKNVKKNPTITVYAPRVAVAFIALFSSKLDAAEGFARATREPVRWERREVQSSLATGTLKRVEDHVVSILYDRFASAWGRLR